MNIYSKLLVLTATLLLASSVSAQSCTTQQQSTQDTCVQTEVQTCLDVESSCQNRVVTAQDVRQNLLEICCCKSGNKVSKSKFRDCKSRFRRRFRRARKIFPYDPRNSFTATIAALHYANDCTFGCDF